MSDLKVILEKQYLGTLKREMANNFREWNEKKIGSPPYDLINLDHKLNQLLYSKIEEIATDIEKLKPTLKPLLIEKLKKELELEWPPYYINDVRYTGFYEMAVSYINKYKNLVVTIYLEDNFKTDLVSNNPELFSQPETINSNTDLSVEKTKYLYPEIFIGNGYQLFILWHEKFKTDIMKQVANYSFIIRSMINDKLITDLKHIAYIDFLSEHNIHISRLKTLTDCNTKTKNELYLELKKSI